MLSQALRTGVHYSWSKHYGRTPVQFDQYSDIEVVLEVATAVVKVSKTRKFGG